jgi:hypothetical protein
MAIFTSLIELKCLLLSTSFQIRENILSTSLSSGVLVGGYFGFSFLFLLKIFFFIKAIKFKKVKRIDFLKFLKDKILLKKFFMIFAFKIKHKMNFWNFCHQL